ncbi:MAG: Na+:solute symporter [Gemmatimonadaceae bacterium]|nr:Na+:solute symporter [Gloeobacterales cyanobacterium ES-bin-141]
MQLGWLDWTIIVAYLLINLLIGLWYTKRASKSLSEFFVSGRDAPWWLVGTSMVATTFAADTPLAVTGLVIKNGIAGNWFWWSSLMSGMLTVFFFARLWYRARILTDVEFTELRYGGRPAAVLRGFRGLYMGIAINSIIMGWVTLAMTKILGLTLGINEWVAVFLCLGLTAFYTVLSGMWGLLVTDAFQFVLKMTGCVALAIFAVNRVGGIDGLKAGLETNYGTSEKILAFTPTLDSPWMPIGLFLVYIGMNWWASWSPGAEPGGGGYVVQRIFSARSEKDSLLATLWFNIAHYALRPWPWIVVALCAMVLYPQLADPQLIASKQVDPEEGFVMVMIEVLPPVWRGFMLAAFAAAYMSTISTHLNWGASYLINDFYKRFLQTDRTEAHYVWASRVATVLVMVLAAVVSVNLTSIEGAWKLLLAIGAGTGPVYLLRWYWWRINAWSEVSAMLGAFLVTFLVQGVFNVNIDSTDGFIQSMLITVLITTVIWVTVTFLTQPESDTVLEGFYQRVRPEGPGWQHVATRLGLEAPNTLWNSALNWICGVVLVYCTLFSVGKFLFGDWLAGSLFLAGAVVSGVVLLRTFSGFNTGDSEADPLLLDIAKDTK